MVPHFLVRQPTLNWSDILAFPKKLSPSRAEAVRRDVCYEIGCGREPAERPKENYANDFTVFFPMRLFPQGRSPACEQPSLGRNQVVKNT
jgi:hypothetical protein